MLAFGIVVRDRTKARQRGRFNLQLVNLSRIPAFALRIAMFLDKVVRVEVVHANLPRDPSGRVAETWRYTYLLPIFPGGGSQWGEGNSAEGEYILRPRIFSVPDLADRTTRLLVEKSQRLEFRGHDGKTRGWDRECHENYVGV